MAQRSPNSSPADICLLLRAHAEQRWLTRRLAPLVRQLEPPRSLTEQQLAGALAYLEVLTIDGARRARETDAALARLQPRATPAPHPDAAHGFQTQALRYHASVLALRLQLRRRALALIAAPQQDPAMGNARAAMHNARAAAQATPSAPAANGAPAATAATGATGAKAQPPAAA
jgi:hypothetical protein